MSLPKELFFAEREYDLLSGEEARNVDVILSAFRSFRGKRRKHIAYVGMAVTSGKRLYDVLSEAGVHSAAELREKHGPDALRDRVIRPNLIEGVALADSLGANKDLLCIAPSVFEAGPLQFSQNAYLSLWYRVIGELAGTHFVQDGWEYSTGAVKEVLFSTLLRWRIIRPNSVDRATAFGLKNFHPGLSWAQLNEEFEEMSAIRVYAADGNELTVDAALEKCVAAVDDLRVRGFEYQPLFNLAWSLMQTPVLSAGQVNWKEFPYNFVTDRYKKSRQRLKEMVDD